MSVVIDLGMHPFADTFISEDQLCLSEPVYPLQCTLDTDSGELKLKYETRDDERYNLYSYSYTSSNSKFSRQHWDEYATEISEYLPKGCKVLEVGSNDGFLTKKLIMKGYQAKGVDPSSAMVSLASDRGVSTYNMLFNFENSKQIKRDFGTVSAIVANNVFNHANNPDDFVKSVGNLLDEGGLFIYELPYWLCTIRDKKFDQIYHEHVTYFTVKYSYNLLQKHGFQLKKVDVVDYHGGSLRIVAKKQEGSELNEEIKDMILREEEYGLFDRKMYKEFMLSITKERNSFMSKIYEIKKNGFPIIGVGAAAKANTFLNFYNMDNSILDYITDVSEHKKGKYTPLTRIPIVGDEIFAQYGKVYALILSWNISDLLLEKIRQINKNVEFLLL